MQEGGSVGALQGALKEFGEHRGYVLQELQDLSRHEQGWHPMSEEHDPSKLKGILATEREEYNYRMQQVQYLSEAVRLSKIIEGHSQKLAACLSDNPVLMKSIVDDLLSKVFTSETLSQGLPDWAVGKGVVLLKDLGSRCETIYQRWGDPRAGTLGPLLEGAQKMWKKASHLRDGSGIALDDGEEEEEGKAEDTSLRFPTFVLSIAIDVDGLLTQLKATERFVDKIFGWYCTQCNNLFKTQLAVVVNTPRQEVTSVSSLEAGLRVMDGFLVDVLSELESVWTLTVLLFGKHAESRNRGDPGDPMILSKKYVKDTLLTELFNAKYHGVSDSHLTQFSQLVSESVNSLALSLLKILLKKQPKTPESLLKFAVNVLALLYNFYGNTMGILHFPIFLGQQEDLGAFTQHMIGSLSEQQPLVEAVAFVLKTIKGSPVEVQHIVLGSMLWEEDDKTGARLIDLFNHLSLLAALSSFTSMRTNSKQIVLDFMLEALKSSQDKGPHAKVAVQRFIKALQPKESVRRDEGRFRVPNFLDILANGFYAVQMPTVIAGLEAFAQPSTTRGGGARQTKALNQFV